ncbi:MAG: galactoside O-acetyltransferase [Methylotenera sp.]|nr:MAG: galactoside O-acetyltransferase [Methylotenera sp.]
MSFYDDSELSKMGFLSLGKNVKISRKASIYNAARISIGDFSRIDDFCVLSAGKGGIHIGRNVHIAVFCGLIGQGSITLADFSGLSSRVMVYSSNDDYSGGALTNPTVPPEFTNVTSAPVHLEKHVIVGSGSIILPGVILQEGVAIGALSLVNRNCERFSIYMGSPAKRVRSRSEKLLESEHSYMAWLTVAQETDISG